MILFVEFNQLSKTAPRHRFVKLRTVPTYFAAKVTRFQGKHTHSVVHCIPADPCQQTIKGGYASGISETVLKATPVNTTAMKLQHKQARESSQAD